MSVLVVGGAGFIGSQVNKMLADSGYHTVIFDNLSRGNSAAIVRGEFVQGDLADNDALDRLFKRVHFVAVMHFAAFTDVGESTKDPSLYYKNNVCNTLNLLDKMRQNEVKVFIFSSSAAIFGLPHEKYVNENHPCQPINPYGETKLCVEKILDSYDRAYGIRSCCLRYFNAAGGDPDGEIKNFKTKESNLIPVVLRSLKSLSGYITIFGNDYDTPDGTGIRDYVHVYDLGTAHILAMKRLLQGEPSSKYNLGNGHGFSVKEVIQTAEKITGLRVTVNEGPRRLGDPATIVACSDKAKEELHWEPKYSNLDTIILHAWNALR